LNYSAIRKLQLADAEGRLATLAADARTADQRIAITSLFKGVPIMLRKVLWLSAVSASLALLALLEASVVQAGPPSGGRSYPYRVGGGGSYSPAAPATVMAGDFTPLFNSEPVFYAYYAPPARSSSGGEEESGLAGPNAAAKIDVTVPASAKVWLDGHETQQTGATRSFVTPALQRGKAFTYDLRVRWTTPAGIVVDITRPIQVQGGRQTMVGFKQ
jgi:uncharacterized protein (TIGR03000 family)